MALSKEIIDKIDALFMLPKSCTMLIYHNDRPEWEGSRMEPLGTGVLLEIDNLYYLITAAHVVQKYAEKKERDPNREIETYDEPEDAYLSLNNLGLLCDGNFYPVQRVRYTVGANLDLAIVYIDDESADELKGKHYFLKEDDIMVGIPPLDEPRYYIYGFPAQFIEEDAVAKTIREIPFKYTTNAIPLEDTPSVRFDKGANILLRYKREKMVTGKDDTPIGEFAPQGISGCGLWFYPGDKRLKLIGIMTEDKTQEERADAMMATRIEYVLDIIRKSSKE